MDEIVKKYKELFLEKKYDQIIRNINILRVEDKTPQITHILGICKMLQNSSSKVNLMSAREDFRETFLKETGTNLGIEALTNFINISTDLLEIKDSLSYYNNLDRNLKNKPQLLKAISRIYQFSVQTKERMKILKKILEINPGSINDWCSYIYTSNFDSSWDQKRIYLAAKEFNNNIPLYNLENLKLEKNIKSRKIRLGFLSSDIYSGHSITYFLRGLIKNINKNKFMIFAISNSKKNETTNEYKNLFNDWYNISNMNDLESIEFVRSKKFDIIIDLMGLTSENRITLLKNKLSPIQITWLGYCNTTGLDQIDYLFADKNLIFANEYKFYSEKIKNFENIWNAHAGFDIKRYEPNLPFLKKKIFTYGSFNNLNKISDENLKVWSKIIHSVRNSRLLLKSSISYNLDNFYERLKNFDLLDKVEVIKRSENFQDHLDLYDQVDLALDTFPYNGVTTTFEALWKSVPVITLQGYNFNSRCGSSIIKNLGEETLLSYSKDEYANKAIDLANNISKLTEIRSNLFKNLFNTSLFDIKNFSRNFEKLLSEIINEKLESDIKKTL